MAAAFHQLSLSVSPSGVGLVILTFLIGIPHTGQLLAFDLQGSHIWVVLAVSDKAISGYQMLGMPRCMFKAQWDFRITAGDRQIFLIQNG